MTIPLEKYVHFVADGPDVLIDETKKNFRITLI